MTEYFRIEGKNGINFDEGVTGPYTLARGNPPRDMSRTLTRQEVISELPRLPLGIRGHALNRGMSMATFPFNIQADTDVAMEQALHDLKETLNEGELYIESESARGTRAVLRYKSDGAVENSYKTLYYGFLEDAGARQVLGAQIKNHRLEGLQLTLYMEPKWRPSAAVMLGPNEIYCPGFEEDGNADGLADMWTMMGAPVCSITASLQGLYAQQQVTNAANEGVASTTIVAPAGVNDAIAYVWVRRTAGIADIRARIRDTTAAADRATADYNAATVIALDRYGYEWRQLRLIVQNNIVAGNNHQLQVYSLSADVTTWRADKAYLKWDTIVIPDEWSDHWLIYNHYDAPAGPSGAAHPNHQNYFDVSDLKGTDPARLLLDTRFWVAADQSYLADLVMARNSRTLYLPAGRIGERHWQETEDAAARSNWAVAVLARCSGGECSSNAANISGYVEWQYPEPLTATLFSSRDMMGRWDVFGMVYTNDIDHTEYRLSYTNAGATVWFRNPWVKQTVASTWQLVYLGEMNFEPFARSYAYAWNFYARLEYAKDATDTVSADCIFLLRKDEPETRLHAMDDDFLLTAPMEAWRWVFDRTENEDYEEKEYYVLPSTFMRGQLCLQGDVMTAKPNQDQRLYFTCESATIGPTVRSWEAHGAATNLQLRIYASYLPQYQSPLD